jgi:hypothetical protein
MPSIVAEIGVVIEQHTKNIGIIHDPEMDDAARQLLAEEHARYARRRNAGAPLALPRRNACRIDRRNMPRVQVNLLIYASRFAGASAAEEEPLPLKLGQRVSHRHFDEGFVFSAEEPASRRSVRSVRPLSSIRAAQPAA